MVYDSVRILKYKTEPPIEHRSPQMISLKKQYGAALGGYLLATPDICVSKEAGGLADKHPMSLVSPICLVINSITQNLPIEESPTRYTVASTVPRDCRLLGRYHAKNAEYPPPRSYSSRGRWERAFPDHFPKGYSTV